MSRNSSGETSRGGVSVALMVGLIVTVFALTIIAMFYAARSGAAHGGTAAEPAPAAVR